MRASGLRDCVVMPSGAHLQFQMAGKRSPARTSDTLVSGRPIGDIRGRPLPALPGVRGCVVELSFEGLEPPERDELLGYPTSFSLTRAQLGKLIAAGPKLLAGSDDFQRLLRALRGESVIGRGIGEDDRCS